jgi:hypothetical protein
MTVTLNHDAPVSSIQLKIWGAIFQKVELIITSLEQNHLITSNACGWRKSTTIKPTRQNVKGIVSILKSQKKKSVKFFCLVQSMIDMLSGLLGWVCQIKEFKLDLSKFLAV